jgi:ribosome maturation factor RimP
MIGPEEWEALVAPLIEQAGLELVKLQVVHGHRQTQLRIFVDHEQGVSVGDCARLCREIGRQLEARFGPESAPLLEVSSAGMSRPIWALEHFRRFRGEKLHFELVEPRQGRLRFRGTIEAVEGERIRLRLDEGEILELTAGEIAAANLELDPWRRRAPPPGSGPTEGEREP